jgi:hypothetical protein
MGNIAQHPYANPLLRALLPRRNVFISYYHGDQGWAQAFVDTFGRGLNKVFTPKALGLNYDDSEIQSDKPDYVMDQIRERYISGSTVHIVLIGPCTHSRRYIDWEIKRSLAKGNGLLGMLIPPHTSAVLPDRFAENWSSSGNSYARYHFYPQSGDELRGWIEDAYQARTTRSQLIHNTRDTFLYNKVCQVCRRTH